MRAAAFTIIAKNYLPFARVLMASLRTWAPDIERIVVLVDRPEGMFDPSQEEFAILLSEDLEIPNSRWFHFKYTILELSTAVKPYAAEHIIRRYGVDQILYFDPDIEIYSPLASLLQCLDTHTILLTPHLTGALDDQHHPSDLDILRSGTYNLGFIGIRNCQQSMDFLAWWQKRLYEHCVVDLQQGLFVDQRWIDLVPGLYEGVGILRNSGFNVAYWNISHRKVAKSPCGYLVNGEPLCFFHFSGFDPDAPDGFSRHQNRFKLSDLADIRELVLEYRTKLYDAGYSVCKGWPYAFGRFENGFSIPDLTRPLHHESPDAVRRLTDPFSAEGFETFVGVWNEDFEAGKGHKPPITRLANRIYNVRTDVKIAMPDIFGRDRERFIRWLISTGKVEHRLEEVFLMPMAEVLTSTDGREAEKHGDSERLPDDAQTERAVLNYLIEGHDADVLKMTRLARSIYESRIDLQKHCPEPCREHAMRFLVWFLTNGAYEYHLDDALLLPFREQWDEVIKKQSFLRRLWYPLILTAISHSLGSRSRMSLLELGLRIGRRFRFETSPRNAMNLRNFLPSSDPTREHLATDDGIGVNLIGYLRAEMGVGESVRCAAKAARAYGIPLALKAVDSNGYFRLGDTSAGEESTHFRHPINVFHINADQSGSILNAIGPAFWRCKYNIGYWAWELEDFPEKYQSSYDFFSEIWTPSTFCRAAISRQSPVPVYRVPHAISVEQVKSFDRLSLGIQPNSFVFLVMCDLLSVTERKNPIGALQAFRELVGAISSCHMVVKVNQAQHRPEELLRIRDAAAGLPVSIIDHTMDRSEVNGLFNMADCFVSLHRSEGFGLAIAEAMCLRRPVIVTGYSGNLDFTKPDNSFLVDYDLVAVPQGCDPYDPASFWAQPRLADAVNQMRTVVNYPDEALKRARRGSAFVHAHLSPESVGKVVHDALSRIRQQMGARRTNTRSRDECAIPHE